MKNGDKKASQKDTKGRFLPGWSGGPGRGKKKELELPPFNFLEELEKVVAKGMRSNDLADNLKAAGLGSKFEEIFKLDSAPMSDFDFAFLRLITNLAAVNLMSGVELMGRMLEVCPGCERLKFVDEEDITSG